MRPQLSVDAGNVLGGLFCDLGRIGAHASGCVIFPGGSQSEIVFDSGQLREG